MAPRGAIPSPEPLRDVPPEKPPGWGPGPSSHLGRVGHSGRCTLCRWPELPRPCVGLGLAVRSPTGPLEVRVPLPRPHPAGRFLLEHRCSNPFLQGTKVGGTGQRSGVLNPNARGHEAAFPGSRASLRPEEAVPHPAARGELGVEKALGPCCPEASQKMGRPCRCEWMFQVSEGRTRPVPVSGRWVLHVALCLMLSGKGKESRQICADPSARSLGTP